MTTEIIEYTETERALTLLREQYGKPFDVTTKAGMEAARAARRLIKSHRVALESARKEIKEPALRRCQLIDAEAKRITAELLALEQPIDAAIQAEERRVAQEKADRERIERERVADIHRRIAEIYATIAARANDDADRIDHALGMLESFDDYGMFDEFADQAKEATQTVVAQLRTMIEQKRQAEAEAAARAEQDRISRIKSMIDEIYAMGSQAFTLTSSQLENVIASVEALNLTGFEEFQEEAMEAQDKTLYGLHLVLDGQRKNEAEAARIAELERQIAEEKRRQAEENARVRREQEAEAKRIAAEAEAVERAKAEQQAREREAEEARQRQAEEETRRVAEESRIMEEMQRHKDFDAWIDGLAEQVEAGMMTLRDALLTAYRSGSGGN